MGSSQPTSRETIPIMNAQNHYLLKNNTVGSKSLSISCSMWTCTSGLVAVGTVYRYKRYLNEIYFFKC
jgi:hypothetical protein